MVSDYSKRKGRKIAVLGGSFNPPHYGHLLVAQEVLRRLKCDEVWLMPCFKHAEEKPLPASSLRMQMTRLAVATLKNPRIKASDLEIRFLPKKNYTADTVRFLQKRFPEHSFAWVFGSELLDRFPHWAKWGELRKMLPIVVYPRPGFRRPPKVFLHLLGAQFVFIPSSARKSRISSTTVRRLLVERNPRAKPLVPPVVFDFIRKRRLYGWSEKFRSP